MSSDPIEVLRKAVVNWQLHRHGADADPGSPANMRYDEACDRLDAALASLSAPKPSSVNDNAVAVNESAPVNDKPESAEAVATVIGYGSDSSEHAAPGRRATPSPPHLPAPTAPAC